jgi:hypothetical protein
MSVTILSSLEKMSNYGTLRSEERKKKDKPKVKRSMMAIDGCGQATDILVNNIRA